MLVTAGNVSRASAAAVAGPRICIRDIRRGTVVTDAGLSVQRLIVQRSCA